MVADPVVAGAYNPRSAPCLANYNAFKARIVAGCADEVFWELYVALEE